MTFFSPFTGTENNFRIMQTNNLGTPYDFNSVMQYEKWVCEYRHSLSACVWGSCFWCSFSPHEALPSPKTAGKRSSLRPIPPWTSAGPDAWARTTSTVWTDCTNVVSVHSALKLSSVLNCNCLGINVHFCPAGNRLRTQEGHRGSLCSHECTKEFRLPSIKTFKRIIYCFSGSISVGVFLLLRVFLLCCFMLCLSP